MTSVPRPVARPTLWRHGSRPAHCSSRVALARSSPVAVRSPGCGEDATGARTTLEHRPDHQLRGREPAITTTTTTTLPIRRLRAAQDLADEQTYTSSPATRCTRSRSSTASTPDSCSANYNAWPERRATTSLLVGDVVKIPPESQVASAPVDERPRCGGDDTGRRHRADAQHRRAAVAAGCTHTIVDGRQPDTRRRQVRHHGRGVAAANASNPAYGTPS